MTLTVTLNVGKSEYDVLVDVGPNNSIPMIIEAACRKAGVSYSAVTSYVIVGTGT